MILWSDEATFNLNGTICTRNKVTYAYQNPHIVIQKKLKSPSLCVWAAVFSGGIIGPYFFNSTVNQENYLDMLGDYLLPEMHSKGLLPGVFFQQDGAPPHWGRSVRDWLDETFPGTWIGRGGPIPWPPRSPDLTPPDFYLWGYLKSKVYARTPETIPQLKKIIEEEMRAIPLEQIQRSCRAVHRRLHKCIKAGGGHIFKWD